MCRLHTISFMITITFPTDSLSRLGILFSSPKMSRKWMLEPDVRAFGQEECNSVFWITSSILISESWHFHLNFIFEWMGRRCPCFENSKRQWSPNGTLGRANPAGLILWEVEIEHVVSAHHVPSSMWKASGTLSDFYPQDKPTRCILQLWKEWHREMIWPVARFTVVKMSQSWDLSLQFQSQWFWNQREVVIILKWVCGLWTNFG